MQTNTESPQPEPPTPDSGAVGAHPCTDAHAAQFTKEIMSDSTRSCSPGDNLTSSDFGSERRDALGQAKQYGSEKKKRKLTLKELHRQKKVKWKEFDCFKLEKTGKCREGGSSINFEKCLNFPGKVGASKAKGTKPINPKNSASLGMGYSFANSLMAGPEDFGYFAQSQKYKTEICKNFELKGKCRWGENCCFAHGKAELRKKTLFNYFYKTKICKHFHKNGYCPYASRCQYFHFKTYQKFQELLESFSNKLFIRIKDDRGESLFSILERTGKV